MLDFSKFSAIHSNTLSNLLESSQNSFLIDLSDCFVGTKLVLLNMLLNLFGAFDCAKLCKTVRNVI